MIFCMENRTGHIRDLRVPQIDICRRKSEASFQDNYLQLPVSHSLLLTSQVMIKMVCDGMLLIIIRQSERLSKRGV